MQIGINDLDDDDFGMGFEPTQEPPVNLESQQYLEPVQQETGDDFMSDFLKSRGIDDPSKIKFEEEDGTVIERSWNDLTKQEQLNIANTPLNYKDNNTENLFDSEEINLINLIRNSGLTPNQYLEQIQGGQVIQEPVYRIDDLSDDEVFLLDLESRVGELSEEEGAQALAAAKLNELFYAKQIEGIRKEYKEREDYESQQEKARIEEEQRQAFEDYQARVVSAIDLFSTIGNLDLNFEDSDKEELAEFMLSQDENGVNYLYQALQDPETLVKAAWFILNGEEAFDDITDYFKGLIKLISQNQYSKGFEDGKKGISKKPQVIIDNSKNKTTPRNYKSIEDLDDED